VDGIPVTVVDRAWGSKGAPGGDDGQQPEFEMTGGGEGAKLSSSGNVRLRVVEAAAAGGAAAGQRGGGGLSFGDGDEEGGAVSEAAAAAAAAAAMGSASDDDFLGEDGSWQEDGPLMGELAEEEGFPESILAP